MEELVERIARGNVTEVKVLLTSVAAALAVYQLVLIAVGYGKLRPRFLGAGQAAKGASRLGGHDRRARAQGRRDPLLEQLEELREERQERREEQQEAP